MPSTPSASIAIIGAGPAGLTLARILSQNSVNSTVFELDASSTARTQGGTLDLDQDDGQLALEACGLTSEFKALARPEGQARKQVGSDGTVLWDDNITATNETFEPFFEAPEIDRAKLRQMLLDSLPGGTVQWGYRLTSIDLDGNGKSMLRFANNDVAGPFDLVVGADGAWSKVRGLLTDVEPFYSGITMAEMWAMNAPESSPWLNDYVGKGSLFMFDEGRALIAQKMSAGNVRVYAAARVDETWMENCGIEWEKHKLAKEELLQKVFDDCSEDLKRMTTECKDGMRPWKLYMLPVGIRWGGRKGLTCIGDAAHLMTPFGGVGVNVAMRDAYELANRIVESEQILEVAVAGFEEEMFPRAQTYAEATAYGLRARFSKEGNKERVEKYKKRQKQREAYVANGGQK